MNDTKHLIKLINDSKLLINKEINTFLYCLILRIFLKEHKKFKLIIYFHKLNCNKK